MGFGDLKTASGQKALNDFLSERIYIEGYVSGMLKQRSDVLVTLQIRWGPSTKYYAPGGGG